MQLLNNLILVTSLVLKPRIKVLGRAENVGEQEVKKRPKLVEVVLERGSSDQETILGVEGADDLRELRVFVLDTVSLINDNVLPGKLFQVGLLEKTDVVGSQANVKVLSQKP
jgi:hypothetical protein